MVAFNTDAVGNVITTSIDTAYVATTLDTKPAQMDISIEKVTVSVKPRALKAEYSLETTRNLKAVNLETFNKLQEFFGGEK